MLHCSLLRYYVLFWNQPSLLTWVYWTYVACIAGAFVGKGWWRGVCARMGLRRLTKPRKSVKKKQVKKKGICCCHFLHFPFIHNFHIDHNASCLAPAPQICITIVSNFSWVLQSSQEKSKRMVMQHFGWGREGKQGALWPRWKWWILQIDLRHRDLRSVIFCRYPLKVSSC